MPRGNASERCLIRAERQGGFAGWLDESAVSPATQVCSSESLSYAMHEGSIASAPSSSDLPTRIVVSLLACSIVSWQLLETTKLPSAAGEQRCCRMLGCPLQWWLLTLMLLSVIEGILMTLADLVLLARRDSAGMITAADLRQELTLTLAIGHADQIIVSLMIIGLGVSGWRSGVKYARVAVGLGAAALLSRRLPAPLLLLPGTLTQPATRSIRPVILYLSGCRRRSSSSAG